MKLFKYTKFFLIGALIMAANQSCTDLEPEVFGEVLADNFYETEEEIISAMGDAYTKLYAFMNHGNYFSIQEVPSDEAAIPQRGTDWFDGGQWLRVHRHQYTPGEPVVDGVWNTCYGGVNACNRVISVMEGRDGLEPFISELRALRALYYYFLLDLYGNVPIIDTYDVPEDFRPANADRQEVFNFIESEIQAVIEDLPKTVDGSTYGRIHYYVAQTILAKLYLNAEVYTGTDRLDDAIAAADEVINSNIYSLESSYFNNFATENSGSTENIFVIPYDQVFATGFNLHHMTLHYESQKTFDFQEQPWNGYCSLQEFYNSFEEDDERITGGARGYGVLLTGTQRAADGTVLVDPGYDGDPDGEELVFTPEINELEPGCFRQAGARLSKYEYAQGATADLSNDFPMFRYADVLLMKAEALWRQNSGSADALALVNQIRERAGVEPFTELNADNLLAERGREMCFEAHRRTDLIRFDRYNDSWWEKPASDATKNIFPIPEGQINANPNLRQNPGY